MKKYTLTSTPRDTKKQKVAKLRREGFIPATVYGKNVKSVSIVVGIKDFSPVYKEAKETGLVELMVGDGVRPVLIHYVQRHPVDDSVLHVEFHQVDLKVKVKAAVPLVFIGESPAVTQKLGVLLTVLSDVEVEALPAELPEKIEVDTSRLDAVDRELKVSDLRVPSGVALLTDAGLVIAKIGALVSKEAEAQAAQEAAAAAESAAETAPTEAAATEDAPKPEQESGASKESTKPQEEGK